MKVSKYFIGSCIQDSIFASPLVTKETIGFPEDYKFAKNEWGAIYYKIFEKRNYHDAEKQCRKDGGTLPIPKSGLIHYTTGTAEIKITIRS